MLLDPCFFFFFFFFSFLSCPQEFTQIKTIMYKLSQVLDTLQLFDREVKNVSFFVQLFTSVKSLGKFANPGRISGALCLNLLLVTRL